MSAKFVQDVIFPLKDVKYPPGIDFIKVGPMAQIIEIALLKLGARRKAHSTPLKSFSKVGRRVQNSLWNRPLVGAWDSRKINHLNLMLELTNSPTPLPVPLMTLSTYQTPSLLLPIRTSKIGPHKEISQKNQLHSWLISAQAVPSLSSFKGISLHFWLSLICIFTFFEIWQLY